VEKVGTLSLGRRWKDGANRTELKERAGVRRDKGMEE
jgi:hypothetical protein